jgi:hypothetical protein
MPALQDHIRLVMLLDGVAQLTATNISVNAQSGAQAVETLQGLAGKTTGSRQLQITGNFAVKLNGLDFDFFEACALGTYHDVQIPIGAKSIVSRGWFSDAGISQGVSSSTEATATFTGSFDPPE